VDNIAFYINFEILLLKCRKENILMIICRKIQQIQAFYIATLLRHSVTWAIGSSAVER